MAYWLWKKQTVSPGIGGLSQNDTSTGGLAGTLRAFGNAGRLYRWGWRGTRSRTFRSAFRSAMPLIQVARTCIGFGARLYRGLHFRLLYRRGWRGTRSRTLRSAFRNPMPLIQAAGTCIGFGARLYRALHFRLSRDPSDENAKPGQNQAHACPLAAPPAGAILPSASARKIAPFPGVPCPVGSLPASGSCVVPADLRPGSSRGLIVAPMNNDDPTTGRTLVVGERPLVNVMTTPNLRYSAEIIPGTRYKANIRIVSGGVFKSIVAKWPAWH